MKPGQEVKRGVSKQIPAALSFPHSHLTGLTLALPSAPPAAS